MFRRGSRRWTKQERGNRSERVKEQEGAGEGQRAGDTVVREQKRGSRSGRASEPKTEGGNERDREG